MAQAGAQPEAAEPDIEAVDAPAPAEEQRAEVETTQSDELATAAMDEPATGPERTLTYQGVTYGTRREMADALDLEYLKLNAYAAFHNEGHHPHVHMLCYASQPRSEYLTPAGIRNIRSELARDIFRQDLVSVYQRQTLYRDETRNAARQALEESIRQLLSGTLHSAPLMDKLERLAERLRHHGGKLVYGYLRPPVKLLVNAIVDELAQGPRVAEAYRLWYAARHEITATYTQAPEPEVPLSQNDAFKPVRNMVVAEAVRLMRGEFTVEREPSEDATVDEAPEPVGEPTADEDEDVPADLELESAASPYVEWTERYKNALRFLYGGKTEPPSFEDAHLLLLDEANAGNALAMHDLGRMHRDGLGREPDPGAAHDWYTKALNGFHRAEQLKPGRYVQYRIGKMFGAGLGIEQNHTEAAKWFSLAARQDYKYAQYSLGCLHRDGTGVEQNHARAYSLFAGAALQDFPYAAFECGKMCRDGTGADVNTGLAQRYFEEAYDGFISLEAERPDDKLQYRIGWMLLTGVGTEKDEAAAAVYFERAARLGNPYAQYRLGKLLLAGDLLPKDTPAALRWLTLSAEQNNPWAQYALGMAYVRDAEAGPDSDRALHWLTLAARQGVSVAAYQIGKLYARGELVEKNEPEAVRWFEQAARDGDEWAQYALGKLLLFGGDEVRDAQAARHWFSEAASQGNPYAAHLLQHMNEWERGAVLMSSTRLLSGIGQIFAQNIPPQSGTGLRQGLDHKRKQELARRHGGKGILLAEMDITDSPAMRPI